MRKYLFTLLVLSITLIGCKNNGKRVVPSATGSIYECLVVIPNINLSQSSLQAITQSDLSWQTGSAYDQPIITLYDLISVIMSEPMPCMPQIETYFKLTNVAPAAFDNFLKPTRNILEIDINPDRYTQAKTHYYIDTWSHPQAVCRLQAPDEESTVVYWLEHGQQIRDWFVRREITRQNSFYRAYTNADARNALKKHFSNIDMLIPEDYMLLMDTVLDASTDLRVLWCCNNKGSMRRDLIVYTYPYTDSLTFTLPYLTTMRDQVLGQLVTTGVEGSHMGTEYKVFPPQFRELTVQEDGYAAEVRGLWKMIDGEAMGGPFVNHTRLDQINNRIVTAECFIFAPGQKKRSALRQAEAVLYTLKMPNENKN